MPRPPVQTYKGDRVWLELSPEKYSSLQRLGRATGVSDFMVLFSIYHVLLQELTGITDTVLGVAMGNRALSAYSKVVGLFINILPVRIESGSCETFLELLSHVRERCLEMYARQDYPREWLIDDLGLKKDLSQALFWQTRYNHLPEHKPATQWGTVNVDWWPREEVFSKSDLTLYSHPKQGGCRLEFVFNVDLFQRETIEGMSRRYEHLMMELVSNPHRSLSAVIGVNRRRSSCFPTPVSRDVIHGGAVSKSLKDLWCQMFNQPSLSPEHSIFTLGADSLQVVQLAAGMSAVLGRPVPVPELIDRPCLLNWAEQH